MRIQFSRVRIVYARLTCRTAYEAYIYAGLAMFQTLLRSPSSSDTTNVTGMSIRREVTTIAPPLVPGSSMGGKFKLSVESANKRVRGLCSANEDGGGIVRDCRGLESRATVVAAGKAVGLLRTGEKDDADPD